MTPSEEAAVFAAFVDTLLPGDDLFPSASAVGVHHWLLTQLRRFRSAESIAGIAAALGASFAASSTDERDRGVSAFQQSHPELFDFAYRTALFGYYQSPLVVEAIRATGIDYKHAPQPEGYDLPPFDFAKDLPTHGRGTYKRTDEITRLDLTGIDL